MPHADDCAKMVAPIEKAEPCDCGLNDRIALAICNAHRCYVGEPDWGGQIGEVEGGRLYRAMARAALHELGM